jgi:hypothetical protein
MCTVSDQLKLCSCKTKDVKSLKHYWRLRREKEENEFRVCIMGSIIPPANIGEKAHEMNENTILKQLNQNNCFDVELQHQENDILELHFTCQASNDEYGNYLAYCFRFENKQWIVSDYDPFAKQHLLLHSGKISEPFLK